MEAEEALVGVTDQGLQRITVVTRLDPHVSVGVATPHQDAVITHLAVTTATAHHAGRHTLLTTGHPVMSLVAVTPPHVVVAVVDLPLLWTMGTDAHILKIHICQRGGLRMMFLHHPMLTAVVAEAHNHRWTIWAQLGVAECRRGEEGQIGVHRGIIAAEAVTEAMMTIIIVVVVSYIPFANDFRLVLYGRFRASHGTGQPSSGHKYGGGGRKKEW